MKNFRNTIGKRTRYLLGSSAEFTAVTVLKFGIIPPGEKFHMSFNECRSLECGKLYFKVYMANEIEDVTRKTDTA